METSTKVLLLFIIYGLPICMAIIYRMNKNKKKLNIITKGDASVIQTEELPDQHHSIK